MRQKTGSKLSLMVLSLNDEKFLLRFWEKGQLLEIHLLEKTARHQNLDCSTLFEQMLKKMKLLENPQKSHFEQMQFLDQNDQLLELQLLDKNKEKCQLLEFKKVESLEHVRQFG
jgi:hypothetical protein